jgi:hypothetical protein
MLRHGAVEHTGQPFAFSEHSFLVHSAGVQGKAAIHASQLLNLQPIPVASPGSSVDVVGVVQKQVIQPKAFFEQVHLLHVG